MNAPWPEVPLRDALWFQEGPGVRNTQFRDAGIKLLNVANITKQGVIDLERTSRYLDPSEVQSKYSHFLLDEGDLVIASSGVPIEDDGLLRTRGAFVARAHLPLCMNTSTIRFKPKEAKMDLRFFRYWLDTVEFRSQITRLVTGSAQKNFGPSHLSRIELPLPPLDEQRRIASLLDQADDLRRKRREALQLLGDFEEVVFTAMFGDPKRQKDRWPAYSFDQSCRDETSSSEKLQRGDYQSAGDFAVVDQGQSEIAGWSNDAKLLCQSHLPVVVFGDHTRAVKYVDYPFIIGADGAKVLKPSSMFDVRYFAELLRKLPIPDLGYSRHMREVKRLTFPCPPLELQRLFAARAAEIDKLKAQHRAHLAQLDALFATLQHRAFRGEL